MTDKNNIYFHGLKSMPGFNRGPTLTSALDVNDEHIGYLMRADSFGDTSNCWFLSLSATVNIPISIDDVSNLNKIATRITAAFIRKFNLDETSLSRLKDLNMQTIVGDFESVQNKIKKYIQTGKNKDLFYKISFKRDGNDQIIMLNKKEIGYISENHGRWFIDIESPDLDSSSPKVVSDLTNLQKIFKNIDPQPTSDDDAKELIRREFPYLDSLPPKVVSDLTNMLKIFKNIDPQPTSEDDAKELVRAEFKKIFPAPAPKSTKSTKSKSEKTKRPLN